MPCIATQSGEVWLLIDDRLPHMISEACEETMMILSVFGGTQHLAVALNGGIPSFELSSRA